MERMLLIVDTSRISERNWKAEGRSKFVSSAGAIPCREDALRTQDGNRTVEGEGRYGEN